MASFSAHYLRARDSEHQLRLPGLGGSEALCLYNQRAGPALLSCFPGPKHSEYKYGYYNIYNIILMIFNLTRNWPARLS